MRIPEVQIPHLRAFDTDDAEKMALRNVEGSAVTRRHYNLIDLFHAPACFFQKRKVGSLKCAVRVNDDRRNGAARGGVFGFGNRR